jgi:hypothetical protein
MKRRPGSAQSGVECEALRFGSILFASAPTQQSLGARARQKARLRLEAAPGKNLGSFPKLTTVRSINTGGREPGKVGVLFCEGAVRYQP